VAIKDWPHGERPRERLLEQGAASLSDAELIAIFLRTGTAGRSAIDVARDALARLGGLGGLLRARPEQLDGIAGLGPAKSAQLRAILELARRSLRDDVQSEPALSTPGKVRDFFAYPLQAASTRCSWRCFWTHRIACWRPKSCSAAR
jgi:DNA repair protein RadC